MSTSAAPGCSSVADASAAAIMAAAPTTSMPMPVRTPPARRRKPASSSTTSTQMDMVEKSAGLTSGSGRENRRSVSGLVAWRTSRVRGKVRAKEYRTHAHRGSLERDLTLLRRTPPCSPRHPVHFVAVAEELHSGARPSGCTSPSPPSASRSASSRASSPPRRSWLTARSSMASPQCSARSRLSSRAALCGDRPLPRQSVRR